MGVLNKRCLKHGERIKVLVVDDSVVIRRLVTHALEEDPSIEVVGAAANGVQALERIAQYAPDLITLDVEMPVMDGIEALHHIRKEHPSLRTIMFSTMTERGAATTLEALAAGADDYVTKASNEGSLDRSLARLRGELLPKIKQFFTFAKPAAIVQTAAPLAATRPLVSVALPKIIAIGVSTGGPAALSTLLPTIPANFNLPVLIVQHMPPLFTRFLADRLQSICALPVREASHGMRVEPGTILIAPGDFHLRVSSQGDSVHALLDTGPALNSCRPSVDALFMSVAEVYGGKTLAIILTGMGRDGLLGAGMLKTAGARIVAQDEATSVVWGMPGAVVQAGLADRVLPLDEIVPAVLQMVGRGR